MTIDVETKYSIDDVIVSKRDNRYTIGLITGVTVEVTSDIKIVYQYKVKFNKECQPVIVTDEHILFKLCDTTIERIRDIRHNLGGGCQS